MKKNIHCIAAAFVLAAALVVGCKPTVTPAQDKTPPAEITELKAVAGNGKISLSWKNPGDADLHQVEIIVQKEGETAVSTVYISVEKGKDSGYIIEGLAANTTYTITVKTIDKSLNKSKAGISKTVTTNAAGSVMKITLTQNPIKETKTNGSVTVTVASSTSIKEAKWVKGVHSANDIFASGTAVSGNSFPVNENGIYSVAVLDNEGRREVETIEIKNIDKTPPAPVSSLTVSYSSSSKKITVNWQNPPDSDFAGLTLSWKKGTGSETPVELTKDKTSYEISDIAPDDSTYTITVSAKDDVGNTGSTAETTVQATATAEITKVELNGRTHFDTVQTDRNITVTVSGSNFDKLTSLLVQVTDGSTNYPAVTAVIDASNNKATATVQAPMPTSPTDEGTRYTVKAIVNSATPAAATASFIVSNPAKVSNIVLTPDKLKVGSATKVSVAVTGTNFDIRGETKIKLLDSNGDEAVGSTVTVAENVGNETEFTAEIANLPAVSGVYTVAVFFKGNKQTETAQLQLYGAPEITSISIPKAGTSYAGNKLPVTIKGKNFTAPNISDTDFNGSGATFSKFKIVSDTLVTAMVDCPYSAGEHPVMVMCGTESSKTGTLSVKDYSTGYDVGKIVLADKTLKSKDEYTAITPTNPPVGIICGSNSYKAPQMIALHTSGTNLQWAKDGSTGYKTMFEGVICRPSQTVNAAETAAFTGDTDGSDNWEYIKAVDPAGSADAATNYPAFHWVDQYNTQYAAQLGGINFAWYMPSLAELCEVYKNRESINESLAKIREQNSSYADSSLGTSWYWSSSQKSYSNNLAWNVNFGGGYVNDNGKDYSERVCCLSGF
ncbi:MAG: fibronectin type III domain-containing protein [Treponema sp.]